jgi:hypothetical protein
MPFPDLVLVGAAEVGVWPMMDTHAYALAHRPVQVDPALGFQARNCAEEMPFAAAMVSQVSSFLTK